jgi:hypothetical protein
MSVAQLGKRQLGPAGGLILGGSIVVGVTLILTLVFSILAWPPWADFVVDDRGRAEAATVVSVEVDARGKGGRVSRLAVVVRLASGEEIALTTQPDADLRPGSAIEIERVPGEPGFVRRKGDRVSLFGAFALVPLAIGGPIGALLVVAGGLLLGRRRAPAEAT